jgi:hypothetical protein
LLQAASDITELGWNLQARINLLKSKCNMRDIKQAKQAFQEANVPISDLAWHIQLYLTLSGHKTKSYIEMTYSTGPKKDEYLYWLKTYIMEQ